MTKDQKDGVTRIQEFDAEIRASGEWREIQFGRHDLAGNHEERKMRLRRQEPAMESTPSSGKTLPSFGALAPRDYGIHPQFATHYARPFRCVLDGKPQPETCPACDAGVPANIRQNILDLVAELEKGNYDAAPSSLVQGQALVIEDLDCARIMDPKNWVTYESVPLKLQRVLPGKLPDIDEGFEEGPLVDAMRYSVMADNGLKNPCSEIALSEPEPLVLTLPVEDHGYYIYRKGVDGHIVATKMPPKPKILLKGMTNPVDNGLYTIEGYGGSACLEGHIGAQPFEGEPMFPEYDEPKINLADFPHKCSCGAPCYDSGFSVQCTASTCRHYKEPK